METPPLPVPPSPDSNQDRQWIIALHLSAFAGLLIPFGNIIAPLVIWLIKKAEIPALDPAGRSVLNFQISYGIYAIVAGLSILVCVGWALLPAVGIAWLVFTILGAVKASNGESYNFPLSIKFL